MLSTKGEGPCRGLLPDYEPTNGPSFQALVSSNNWFTNSRSSSYYSKEEKSVHTMVITGTQSSPCEFLSAFIVWPLMVSTEAGHLGHTQCCRIKVRWRMNERDLLICFWLSPILLFAVYGSIWSATLQDLVGVCSKQPALCRAITVFYFHIYSVFQFWHQCILMYTIFRNIDGQFYLC